MDNKTTIGIGVVLLAGVGYYLYTKNKKNQTPLVNMPNKPALPTFDRDKASREFAKFAFPIMDKARKDNLIKNNELQQKAIEDLKRQQPLANLSREQVLANSLTKYRADIASAQPISKPLSELLIYQTMLASLNSITDDSDAEFAFNAYKKYVELGEKAYNPDLDTQIRFESFRKKYPKFLKPFDKITPSIHFYLNLKRSTKSSKKL